MKKILIIVIVVLLVAALAGVFVGVFVHKDTTPDNNANGNNGNSTPQKAPAKPAVDPTLINVGDEITTIYFNPSMSKADIYSILNRLDWSKHAAFANNIRTMSLVSFDNGCSIYIIRQDYDMNFCFMIMLPSGHADYLTADGLSITSVDFPAGSKVTSTEGQDVWKELISKTPFAN